jgi:hypothetical protein
MIPQSGIEYETFILIVIIVIGISVIGCKIQYMIAYDTPPEGKKPQKAKRMYPKDVIKMKKGRGYKAIADYLCGNCGHKILHFQIIFILLQFVINVELKMLLN